VPGTVKLESQGLEKGMHSYTCVFISYFF